MLKKIIVQATYIYELEVDTESSTVNDYDSEQTMIEDLVYYRFGSVLPVINNGVEVRDIEVGSYEIIN